MKMKTRHNNVMHVKPDLRVLLKWMIAGSGSVITDVIGLRADELCAVDMLAVWFSHRKV